MILPLGTGEPADDAKDSDEDEADDDAPAAYGVCVSFGYLFFHVEDREEEDAPVRHVDCVGLFVDECVEWMAIVGLGLGFGLELWMGVR